ncbi:MAG: GlcG/HbpS family heme-binding protein [Povalibacter sp.]
MMNSRWMLASAALLITQVHAAELAPGQAASPPPAAPVPAARGPALDLSIEAAREALSVCQAKGFNVSVTVVDSAGVQKVLLAADGAHSRGVQSSTNKAVTALTFKDSTSQLGEKIKTDTELAAKIAANPNFNTRAGGVLLHAGSDVIGAIGVGGAKGSENDEACAVAGIDKVKARLK